MIETIFWSIFFVTWVSYGMHVLKEYNRIRKEKGDVNEDYLLALDELRNDAEKRKKTQTDDTFDEVVVY